MGFKIGRSEPAPELETKVSARFGEQKVVATETPVATEQEEVVAVDAPRQDESDDKPVKVKRGRKPKKA